MTLFNAKTGETSGKIELPAYANWLSFSPDDKTLVSISTSHWRNVEPSPATIIHAWDLENDRQQFTMISDRKLLSAAISPDGEIVAVGCDDGHVRFWDMTGRRLSALPAHENPVRHVRYSPDGRTLATSSQDQTIKIWDIEKLKIGIPPKP